MIYLDYSATTPVDARVLQAFLEAGAVCGNYNASNGFGRIVKNKLDDAVAQLQMLLDTPNHEIICTSGATESNNLAIKGVCRRDTGKIITTNFEHASVYAPITALQKRGFKVAFVRTQANGLVDVAHLEELLDEQTCLVSIAAVSSEIGYLQPIDQLAALVHQKSKAVLHVDATQAIGKMEISLADADLVSFSAHKFYGVKGVGVLLKRQGIPLMKELVGGHSLSKLRSGTPPTELILSMTKALALWQSEKKERLQKVALLRSLLEQQLALLPYVRVNNPGSIAHIANLSVRGKTGEEMQKFLDENEIAVSVGSACSATPYSRIVEEITADLQTAKESFRVSLSHLTTEAEVMQLVECLKEVH
ncbi:MAG: cysteine desulfurase family protein [Lachnospiraceae bacterium]